jgi:hypothetical protein
MAVGARSRGGDRRLHVCDDLRRDMISDGLGPAFGGHAHSRFVDVDVDLDDLARHFDLGIEVELVGVGSPGRHFDVGLVAGQSLRRRG